MTRPAPRAWHRAEHLFVVAALLALAFTMLGRAAARLPKGGALDQRIERSVHEALPPFAASVLGVVSFFGSTVFAIAGAVAVVVVLVRIGARRRLRAFLLAVAGAALWVQVLKAFFHRARPDLFHPLTSAMGFGFPSGHSAVSAAFFGSVAGLAAASSKRGRHAAGWLAAGLAVVLLVGFSRIALGVHWTTDVLGGWSVGFGWLALVFGLAERQARRARELSRPAGRP